MSYLTVYQWLCLLGVPALIAGTFKAVFSQIKAVKLGIQALLRTQMILDYNKYAELGYAPIYARESFQNCWEKYHALGVNGVMDDIHNKFLMLPIEPQRKDDEV